MPQPKSNAKTSSQKCDGMTKKGARCTKAGSLASDGKYYCYLHDPNKGEREPKATSKAVKESKKVVVDDDMIDISSSTYSWLLPAKMSKAAFNNFVFANVEQAYHFMKFYYPMIGKEGNELIEICKQILGAKSIETVRAIAQRNSNRVIKMWNDSVEGTFTYGDRVLFDIMCIYIDNNISLKNKLISTTVDFSDDDSSVNIDNYTLVLKALRKHFAR